MAAKAAIDSLAIRLRWPETLEGVTDALSPNGRLCPTMRVYSNLVLTGPKTRAQIHSELKDVIPLRRVMNM